MLSERVVSLDADAERLRIECEQAQLVEAGLVADLEAAEARRAAAEARQRIGHRGAPGGRRRRCLVGVLVPRLCTSPSRALGLGPGPNTSPGVDDVLGTLLDLIDIDTGLGSCSRGGARRGAGSSRRGVAASRSSGARLAPRLERARRGDRARGDERPSRRCPWFTAHRCGRTFAASKPVSPNLLDAIIGSAVRVSTWADAIDVAIANPQAVVVTDDGDRFGPTGWRVGVASGGATASALEEAQERLGIATAEVESRTRAEQMARIDLDAARTRESQLSRQLDTHDAGFSASSDALARSAERTSRHAGRSRDVAAHRVGGRRATRPRARPGSPNSMRSCRRSRPTRRPKPRPQVARRDPRPARCPRRACSPIVVKISKFAMPDCRSASSSLQRRLEETERRLEVDAVARAHAGSADSRWSNHWQLSRTSQVSSTGIGM